MSWLYSEYTVYTRSVPKKKEEEPGLGAFIVGCIIIFLVVKGLLS